MSAVRQKIFSYSVFCMVFSMLGIVLITTGSVARADVFRWVDDKGNVHFSDSKPNQLTDKVQELDVKAPPVVANPELDRAREQNRARFEALDAERELKAQQQAKLNAVNSKKKKHCSYMRRKLAAYEKASYLYTLDKNGERIIQEDKTKQRVVHDLKKMLHKEC